MMDKVIIYIHGQGGNADEAKHDWISKIIS